MFREGDCVAGEVEQPKPSPYLSQRERVLSAAPSALDTDRGAVVAGRAHLPH